MSLFLISLREFILLSAILLLFASVYRRHARLLITSAALALCAGFALTWVSFPLPSLLRKAYSGLMFYSFLTVLFLSFVSGPKPLYPVVALVLLVLLPSAQLAAVVFEEVRLAGRVAYLAPAGALVASALLVMGCLRALARFEGGRFFGYDGVLIFAASLSIAFGGVREFDDTSLVASLQGGIYSFISSLVPSLRNLLLLPSGAMAPGALDDALGFLSSQRVAMALTAAALFLPPVWAFLRLLFSPEPSTEGIGKKAERRRVLSVYIGDLMRRGTPLIVALLVFVVLLHAANLSLRPTYDPEPLPVVAEGDLIAIPLVDRSGDIADGKMRKYSILHEGQTYRFIVMMRPDGEVVAALDACEVCPPRGYVQRADHVVCKYCNTPLPSSSVGQPGGCNPIPLPFRVEGDTLTLRRGDIVEAFGKHAGKETGSVLR